MWEVIVGEVESVTVVSEDREEDNVEMVFVDSLEVEDISSEVELGGISDVSKEIVLLVEGVGVEI